LYAHMNNKRKMKKKKKKVKINRSNQFNPIHQKYYHFNIC
jgi:hypothetical protein